MDTEPKIKIAAAVPQTKTKKLFPLTFMITIPALV